MAVPNQKQIAVNKELSDRDHIYSIHNLNALDYAAGNLQTAVGFKLYMYMAKNQDKYKFDLSNVLFCNWAGCGRAAYNSAVKELIDKGYLVEDERQKNLYNFYEYPRMKEETISIMFAGQRNYTMTI